MTSKLQLCQSHGGTATLPAPMVELADKARSRLAGRVSETENDFLFTGLRCGAEGDQRLGHYIGDARAAFPAPRSGMAGAAGRATPRSARARFFSWRRRRGDFLLVGDRRGTGRHETTRLGGSAKTGGRTLRNAHRKAAARQLCRGALRRGFTRTVE